MMMGFRKSPQASMATFPICILILISFGETSADSLNHDAAILHKCPTDCECTLKMNRAEQNTRPFLVVKCNLGHKSLQSLLQQIPINTTHLFVRGENNGVKSIQPGSFQRLYNLKVLEIDNFEITKLSNDTFTGLESLEELVMRNNKNLQFLESCVFCPLQNLRYLSFWFCYKLSFRLSASDVPKALCGLNKAKIETLVLHHINKLDYKGTGYLLPKYFHCLQGSNLKTLDLTYNWLALINAGLPDILPNIEYLIFAQNNIIGTYQALYDLIKFTKLRVFNISNQNGNWLKYEGGENSGVHPAFLDQIANNTDTNGLESPKHGHHEDDINIEKDNVKEHTELKSYHADQYCSLPFTIPLPQQIVEIDISNFRPGLEIKRGLCFAENPIMRINIANSQLAEFRGPVKGFNKLAELDISDNLLGVREDIARDAFYFLPSLRVLLLGNNNLGRCLPNDTDGLTFSQLPKLEELDLSRNNIIYLPSNTFKGLANLNRLNISGNKIVSFHVNFKPNPRLVDFDLSNNELRSLSAKNRETLDALYNKHGELFHVDLNNNNFICSCKSESSEYLKWFKETKPFLKSYGEYECFFSEDDATYRITNLDINHYRAVCDYTNILITKIVAGFVSLGIVIAIATKLIHFYRWRIRYWNFAFKLLWKRYRYKQYIEVREIKYDAFVSFQNDDLNWVSTELCNHIEDEGGFKLCIHHRDFKVGDYIVDSIVNAVQSSRQTIIVVSENYLNSNYTQFELQVAYSTMIDKGVDVIIAVVLDPIEDLLRHPKMTSTLKRLLMQKTYIKWNTHEFWERLKLKLMDDNRVFDI